MSKTYPSQSLKQVLLRIPDEMRDKLEEAAKENGRSLTAEVIARLESTFPASEPWLSRMQRSPSIKIEKRLLAVEAGLEGRLEALEKQLSVLVQDHVSQEEFADLANLVRSRLSE
ncbi:Arc family DNA-binding protein [Aquibium sp. LZ166]|uniref:Arc family DNA-binding protein n=1 Tax=Aquibium pacificus TaxID=3153579 RepID=A0ABV3SBE9_9HYPH